MAITNDVIFKFQKADSGVPTIGGCSKGYTTVPTVAGHTTITMSELKIPGGVCGYPFIDTDLYWVDTFSDTVDYITLQYNGELIVSGGASTSYPILVALKQNGSVDWKTGYTSSSYSSELFTNSVIDGNGNIFVGAYGSNVGSQLSSILKFKPTGVYTWDKGETGIYINTTGVDTEQTEQSSIFNSIVTLTSAGVVVVARQVDYIKTVTNYNIPNPDFPPSPGNNGTEITNNYKYSILVDFYNTNGTLINTIIFKGRNSDTATDYNLSFPTPTPAPVFTYSPTSYTVYYTVELCNDHVGNCFLSGGQYDEVNSPYGTITDSNRKATVTKLTSTGSILWNISIPNLQINNTFTDRYGEFYIAGNILDSSGNIINGTIVKLHNTTGAIVWQRVFAVDSVYTNCYACIDCSLNIYAERRDASNNSIFFKMTQTGSVLWARVLTIT
jgi:hypothetical protein